MILNYKKFNPLGFHLLKLMQDTSIRNIILFGGSSSGKTYSMAQCVLIMTMWEGTNHLVMRKVGASIKDSVYQDFKTAVDQLGIAGHFRFTDGTKTIKCLDNNARIVFKGLDDAEKIKGLSSFKRVILDEWSEYEPEDYKQIRLRLRGMKGQQIITTFNPIKETHWIKKDIFDKQNWHDVPMTVELGGMQLPAELTEVKSIKMNEPRTIMHKRTGELITHAPDTVVIQTTYLNNFWVVGSPDGTYGYYDDQCIATFEYDREHDPDYYNVYALGEWGVIRSGAEFFSSFNRGMHTAEVKYNPELPIHLSIDNNRLPYISISYWQIDTTDGVNLIQIDETCAEAPNNSARKAAKLVARRLHEYGVDKIFLHGDATTKNGSTVDDECRSFFDLFIDQLHKDGIDVVDMIGNKNPSVPMSGEFINTILDGQIIGYKITIGENCVVSTEDYMSVQKDANGAIQKTKVKNKISGTTYEEHGHLSDTFRYVVCDVFKDEFTLFSNKRKRNKFNRAGMINYYNPDTECAYVADVMYIMPDVNDRTVAVHGMKCGDKWHIVSVEYHDEVLDSFSIENACVTHNAGITVFECARPYYPVVRSLRDKMGNVRVKKEGDDMPARINATSSLIENHVLFNPILARDDEEYRLFIESLLDYGKDQECIYASACLSGFMQFVLRNIAV